MISEQKWVTQSVADCLDKVPAPACKLLTKDYKQSGQFPIVDQGQELIAGWTDNVDGVIQSSLPLVVFGDHTRALKYIDFPFARGADGTQLLKPKNSILPLFFYYACKAIDIPARGYNRHFTILKEKDISFPESHEEQSQIASALRKIELSISLQEEELSVAQELKRATMRELFTRGLRGEKQKETEIGLVPESWEITTVGDHTHIVSKGSSPKWQGFEYTDQGILFVRSQNIGDGVMLLADKVYLSPKWNEKEKRSILKNGDVLINLVGASIGRVAIGGEEIENANCNQAVAFIRLKKETILGKFLVGFLLSEEGQKQIHGQKKDIARANLSLEDVRSFYVPKPKIQDQKEIIEILNAIDQKIDLHKRKKSVLEELFKSLLHKLMTGEIRVADLDLSVLDIEEKERATA